MHSTDTRHEPLPSLPLLPLWLWRRTPRWARVLAVVALLGAVAGAAAAVPGLRESRQEADERREREQAQQRAAEIRRLRAEQRPVLGRSAAVAPAGAQPREQLASRARLMDDLLAAIAANARARVRRGDLDGPIRRVACESFPRSVAGVGADLDLSRDEGRFACLAVTSEFEAGRIGHTYRAIVAFDTGRYGFCKISGRPGPEREQPVTVPRPCGGA